MVLGGDDKVAARQLKVSRAIGDQWLVEDGLAAGERVVVEDLQKIQPGVQVEVAEFRADAAPGRAPAPQPPAPAQGDDAASDAAHPDAAEPASDAAPQQ